MNENKELAPRETHIVFGNPKITAHFDYHPHPRRRYGKTKFDRMPIAERIRAREALRR